MSGLFHVVEVWQFCVEIKEYFSLYFASPCLKCYVAELSLRVGLVHAYEIFMHLRSTFEPHP